MPLFANAEPRPQEWKSSGYPFLDSLVPSYVSVDTDGRVVRLDTFSKTVAPGCRLGWITAQPALIERIFRITETSTQQPSGFVQAIVAELVLGPDHKGLDTKAKLPVIHGWKGEGWVRWLEGLRGNYERRMNTLCHILDQGQYLVKSGRRNSLLDSEDEWSVIEKTQPYSFDWPVGGMFIWWKIHFNTHPLFSGYRKEPERFSRAFWIWLTTEPYRVLVAPGMMFSPTPAIAAKDGWKYFRICFAAIDEGELGPTGERLVNAVADFWKIRDRKIVEDILEEDEKGVVIDHAGMSNMMRMIGPC